jgi:pSer/pThr/pTyr-binding forkhead associated (FHA) protein
MFTNPSAAPTSVTATAPSNSSSRPSRTDRIRTLGLLRGYRQSHSHLFSHTTEEAAEVLPAESNAVSEPISSSTIIPVEEIKTVEDSPTTAVELSPRVQAEASEKKSSPVRWIPGAGSLTGVSRSTVQAQATAASRVTAVPNSREAIASAPALDSATMARTRAANGQTSSYRGLIPTYTAAALDFARLDRGSPNNASNSASSSTRPQEQAVPTTDAAPATSPGGGQSQMPSIRFVPHQDVHSTRPSLQFQAVSRIVSNEGTILRVGRYSEREEKAAGARDGNNTTSGPVGFKSKVVSRRHCEFWCTNGQWYIKDVRSSSGTFLNHIRLSQPNVESRPFPVNDGDVVQLGIDFKGGEEMIFRCVKIRVECNRGWQKALNNFKYVGKASRNPY